MAAFGARGDPCMEEGVSPEVLELCLDLISLHPKGASDIRLPPGEVYCHASPGVRNIYINFIKPSEVPVGSIYLTWVIRSEGGKPGGVSYYRSRRGEAADDTLPPDD